MSKTIEKRFHDIRRKIEGLRIRHGFETSYFMPPEEEMGTIPVNRWHYRILSELDFCLQMKSAMGTDVEEPVSAALAVLEQAANDGAFPDSVCQKAENCLLPLAEEAKSYKLILAGHAHIDMNWKWSWDETVATTIATFRTMLKLMEEYPEFHFSQSQASTYKIIEDNAPWMMDEIKERIREGRWEVTASSWVESDKNMPCTESLKNQVYYAKKYMSEHWGVDAESLNIDFSPDTFGHSAHLPELDALLGLKYYYHCRGIQDENLYLYRWKAPSGREILAYKEPYWYSAGLYATAAIGLPRFTANSGGLRTGLMPFGVGDHGGGPTRRDLNRGLWMQQFPVFPQLVFGRFSDFFAEAEKVRELLPVVDTELNPIFTGCYTTQSRIKRGNRRSEAALLRAEKTSALMSFELGSPYHAAAFEKGWQNTLFTHFHDILTGSCVQDSREHAMGLYQQTIASANAASAFALEQFAAAVDTSAFTDDTDEVSRSMGAGAGFGMYSGNIPTHETACGYNRIYNVVNTSNVDREENVMLTIWDWSGTLSLMEFTDEKGNVLPSQRITDWIIFWQHRYVHVLVKVMVPANGYTTVLLREKSPEIETDSFVNNKQSYHRHLPFNDIVLENDYIKAMFDSRTGELYSLVDKATGNERLKEGETAGLRYVIAQKHAESSWVIDRWVEVRKIEKLLSLNEAGGSLRSAFTTEHDLDGNSIKTTVSLDENDKFLKVKLEIDWKDDSKDSPIQPLLYYMIPLRDLTDRFICGTPAGSVVRHAAEIDVPAQRFAAAEFEDGRALSIASDSKYGFRLSKGALYATLINVAEHPDPYPERGIHEITLYILACGGDVIELERESEKYMNPLQYVSNTVHGGSLNTVGSFMNINGESVVCSGVTEREGRLTLSLFEAAGKNCDVTVSLTKDISEALLCDIFGRSLDIPLNVSKNTVNFTLAPYTEVELRVKRK